MAKKRNPRKQHAATRPIPTEARGADALTVAWTMSVITTVLCGLVAGAILVALGDRADADAPRMFGRLLHFSAFIAAVLSLLLLACVLRFRQQAPPASITWIAVISALTVIGSTFLY